MIRMIHTTASIKYTQPEQSQIDENENEKKHNNNNIQRPYGYAGLTRMKFERVRISVSNGRALNFP